MVGDNIEVYESAKKWLKRLQAKSRSLDFEKSSTKRAGLYWLAQFCKFVGSNPDALIAERLKNLESKNLNVKRTHEELVESYVIQLKSKNKSPNTISTAVGLIRSFYKNNYARLEQVASVRPYSIRPFKVPTVKDIKKMCATTNPETKAWILCQFNSGLGNTDLLSLSLVNLSSEYGTIAHQLRKGTIPVHIEVRRQKTGEATHSFFGPNAIEALKEHLGSLNGRGRIFKFHMRTIQQRIKALAIRAKVATNDVPVTPYSLRKAFNTYMKLGDPSKDIPGINEAFVELMMGHSIGRVRSAYFVTGRGSTGTGIPISTLAQTYMNTYPAIDITKVA